MHLQNQHREPNHIQIKIKIPNRSQEPPVPNLGLKDMNVLGTFKVKIESQNMECGCINIQLPYANKYQDSRPKSGTSSCLKSPKSGVNGLVSSLQLQNQDREPKFRTGVYQRPVIISKSRSRCQTPVRNLQLPPKPHIRT